MPRFKKKLSPHRNCSTSETCCWGLDWLDQRLAAFTGPGATTPSQDRTEGGRNTFNSRHRSQTPKAALTNTTCPERAEEPPQSLQPLTLGAGAL